MDVAELIVPWLLPVGVILLVLSSLHERWTAHRERRRMTPAERAAADRAQRERRRRPRHATGDDTRYERGWGTQWDDPGGP